MPKPKQRPAAKLAVILGPGWTRFTYSRQDMEAHGIVKRGLQMGALCRLPTGAYVQVNGDVITALNPSQIALALRRAGAAIPHLAARSATDDSDRVRPIVTIKKRRHIVVPSDRITARPKPAPSDAED
ncbi:hypothetical protein [Pelomonas sp. KK5]|uniref:hypothetical protein n=1 Tax=Pelomonas sp. KK5 TaxID=1855730 RepID=UPI0011806411|nr:hypothetical protein [Pelomonas sp. KK5]